MGWLDSRWVRCLPLVLAIFQIVVMVDTILKNPNNNNLKGNKYNIAPSSSVSERGITIVKKGISTGGEDAIDTQAEAETASPTGTGTETEKNLYTYTYSDDVENDEIGDGNESTQRTVYWMDHTAIYDNYFSGTWIQPIERFQRLNVDIMSSLEDASHRVFFENKEDVRMTVDWLDFAVEHLSKWCKKLDITNSNHNSVAIDKITGNLLRYIQATPEKTKVLLSKSESKVDKPLLHPTIAVISHGAVRTDDDTPIGNERSKNLTVTTLGATITSLLRVGIGRIVVTGLDDLDASTAMETFRLIGDQFAAYTDEVVIVDTELAYVNITEEKWIKSEYEDVHRPRATLYGLQEALNGNLDKVTAEKWLGTLHDQSYWKYIYSTEPDLILQTRFESLPAIHKALEKGRVVMPHRLQPVAHKLDLVGSNGEKYNGSDQIIPAKGKFHAMELDGAVDMCCDDGRNNPKWDPKDDPADTPCYTWWYDCGYTREWQGLGISEKVKHRRLLYYVPFIRLSNGANIISISGSEHERKCRPQKRQTPSDVCQRPTSSGRSFAISEQNDSTQ
ncbi:unnamed protein product [Pseudo-nitzschia multistriata]|uniref:Uncharacterized protein n=1 Tax=Pseudo-nitzschia multistriata TaxID=183589 RepID=A0A448Z123_9STRA|nr:unnamed protein product [Pseudo-nitzschia multistriata]